MTISADLIIALVPFFVTGAVCFLVGYVCGSLVTYVFIRREVRELIGSVEEGPIED